MSGWSGSRSLVAARTWAICESHVGLSGISSTAEWLTKSSLNARQHSTFYQMSTRFKDNITQSVGLYTSGGGAAGLAGALTYTVLTQLGASPSAVISGTGLVPLVILTIYNFWLPGFPKLPQKEEKKPGARKEGMIKDLGTRAKLSIARPIVAKYMLPLCTIFLVELINVQVSNGWAAHTKAKESQIG